MRIDYDTEFLDDGERIHFISIGMVREDGATFYAVTDDIELIEKAAQNPWLLENVINSLPYVKIGRHWYPDPTHKDFVHIYPRNELRRRMKSFVLGTVDVELWAWYAAYDHVVLSQIFGRMLDLPEGIPMYTMDLKQEHHRLGFPELPEQKGGQHNALSDALWNKQVGELLRDVRA